MADVVDIPSKGIPAPFTPREIWDAPKPTDQQVWGVCPYLRNFEKCKGCPEYGIWRGEQVKDGCRAFAEEACRIVMAGITTNQMNKEG